MTSPVQRGAHGRPAGPVRALAVPSHEITAEQLAVLRAAAESWLVQEEALQCAVAELGAFAAERGVPVVSIPARQSGDDDRRVAQLV